MVNDAPIKTRPLVLRRDQRGQVALHDAASGEMLGAQAEVNLRQLPGDTTEVTVRFLAHGGPGLRIEIND